MIAEYERNIVRHVKRDDWYMWANMKKGGITLPLFTSLDAYWPGVQVLCVETIIIIIIIIIIGGGVALLLLLLPSLLLCYYHHDYCISFAAAYCGDIIQIPIAENLKLSKGLSFGPGGGQNIALHSSPDARKFTILSFTF